MVGVCSLVQVCIYIFWSYLLQDASFVPSNILSEKAILNTAGLRRPFSEIPWPSLFLDKVQKRDMRALHHQIKSHLKGALPDSSTQLTHLSCTHISLSIYILEDFARTAKPVLLLSYLHPLNPLYLLSTIIQPLHFTNRSTQSTSQPRVPHNQSNTLP